MLRVTRLSAIAVLSCLVVFATAGQALNAKTTEGKSRFAKLDGNRIHYEDHGKGREALVFVHGWTCSLNFWSRQVPAFEGKARIIAIDLPGHGQSDKPQVSYTMDLFARAVNAVLEDAGVDRAVLAGHSMGTPVIRQFYRKYPDKTLALVFVDGSLRPFGKTEDVQKLFEPLRGPGYKEFAVRMIDGMFGANASPELRAEVKNVMLNTPQHVAVSAMEGMIDPAIWKDDKIEVPALAVMTKNWPPDTEQVFRGIAPKLDYRAMEGVGHFLMMEKPAEFNEILAGFLSKNALIKK